jgi:hypothetical protein
VPSTRRGAGKSPSSIASRAEPLLHRQLFLLERAMTYERNTNIEAAGTANYQKAQPDGYKHSRKEKAKVTYAMARAE